MSKPVVWWLFGAQQFTSLDPNPTVVAPILRVAETPLVNPLFGFIFGGWSNSWNLTSAKYQSAPDSLPLVRSCAGCWLQMMCYWVLLASRCVWLHHVISCVHVLLILACVFSAKLMLASGRVRWFSAISMQKKSGTRHEIQRWCRDSQDITCNDILWIDASWLVPKQWLPELNLTQLALVNWGYHQLQRCAGRVCLRWFVAQPLLDMLDDVFESHWKSMWWWLGQTVGARMAAVFCLAFE